MTDPSPTEPDSIVCPFCCEELPTQAFVCRSCGGSRKALTSNKWMSARAGRRDDIVRAGLGLALLLALIGAILGGLFATATSKPSTPTRITCSVSDPRWPDC